MTAVLRAALALLVLPATSACREGAPIPDYSGEQDAFDRATTEPPPPLEEPDPYVDGQTRLVISNIFNETGFSEFIPVDGARANYFIFDNGSGQNTYAQETIDDRVEGSSAEEFILEPIAQTFGWGGGFVLDPPVDLTPYDVVVVHLASETIDDVVVRIGDASAEVAVLATDFGFATDGAYHEVRIPLSEYADGGVDLSRARLPFAVGGLQRPAGESIRIDYLYWEAE